MSPLHKNNYTLVFIILLYLLCYKGNVAVGQNKEQDVYLASQLKKQFGPKAEVVCLNSKTVVSFDRVDENKISATKETTENFISLKDDYTFVNVLGCDDYINVSDVKVFDNKNRPLYTTVVDQSNEEGEDFYSDSRLRVFKMFFSAMGDKMSYEAQTSYTDLKYLTQVYAIDFYPIMKDSVVFKVPDWLNIDFKELNFDGYDLKKTVTKDAENHTTVYTYTVSGLPAAHFGEKNVPGSSYMFPHILVMCKSFIGKDGKTMNILSSADDLYNWYEKLIKETGNDDEALKPIVNSLIQGKTKDIDKAKAIYYWVEDNIRYLAFENGIVGYKPAACQTVLKNKYGDCKCMANLLTEMLKIAGLDARRAWLGTKELNYDLSTPSLAAHNHAICVLVLNGKHYYLDATEGYASLGNDNDMIQGRELLVEDGNSFFRERIPVAPIDNNKTEIDKTLTLNGDIITGDAHYTYNGDAKTIILYEYNHLPGNEKDKAMKHFIEHNDPNITLGESNTSDLGNRDIPININYTFSIKNQVTQFDKDTYISMDYDKALDNLQFDSARYCDYEFDFRENYNVNDTLVVPQGYTIKHIPDNMNVSNADYSFVVKVSQEGNKLIYHKEIRIFNEIIRKKNFQAWNSAVKQLKDICEDQVVLTKQ